MEAKNAKIISTMLGYEDHGILTFSIFLDYGGSSQSAGGYCLDKYDEVLKRRLGTEVVGKLISEILHTVGVERWEAIPGKVIRVKADFENVYAIGHFLEDRWLNFAEFFEQFK